MATAIIRAPYDANGQANFCQVYMCSYAVIEQDRLIEQNYLASVLLIGLREHAKTPEQMATLTTRGSFSVYSADQVASDLPYVLAQVSPYEQRLHKCNEAAADMVFHFDNGEWQLDRRDEHEDSDWVEPEKPADWHSWAFMSVGNEYRLSASARPALTDGDRHTYLTKSAPFTAPVFTHNKARYSIGLANGDTVRGEQGSRRYISVSNLILATAEFTSIDLRAEWDSNFLDLANGAVLRRSEEQSVDFARATIRAEVLAVVGGWVEIIVPIMQRRTSTAERIIAISDRNNYSQDQVSALIEMVPQLVDYDLISGLEFCSACASESQYCDCYTCDNCTVKLRLALDSRGGQVTMIALNPNPALPLQPHDNGGI